jgi:predicted AlkP superfamily pyrophosphatase or phosphodiesterase
VFPTVTRVNATAIGTGAYPDRNGILGNRIYIPAVDPNHAFVNDNYKNLFRLDQATNGNMVLTKSLAEILAERGKRLAVVSSGGSGQSLLLSPRAPQGVGVLINGYWDEGTRVAFPPTVSAEVLRRFGPAPHKSEGSEDNSGAVTWTGKVLRDYALPELKPDVLFYWLTEPDHSQHELGTGSPQALATIRNDDAEVGLLLKTLDTLGLAGTTNIMVTSDHGFSVNNYGVNTTAELIKAGLKANADSDDVVIASSGQSLLLHVKNRDRALIHRITEFLKAQPWTGVLFTAGDASQIGVPVEGTEPGTFAIELIHLAHPERGPDIVLSFPWSSAPNGFGVPGTDFTESRATGPLAGARSNHGSMSPWTVRNTFLAWGVDFKKGATVRTPVSNVDLAPTLLALLGLDRDATLPRFDGRVIAEAFADGPDHEQVPLTTTTHVTATPDGKYRAAIQVSEVGTQRYIDKSWRLP